VTADSSFWARYEPNDAAPWNRQRVVHLHRRAGYAATWAEQERDLADGPQKSVDRLLMQAVQSKPVFDNFDTMAQTIGDAAMASGNPTRLKAWWLYRMLFSPDPLGERLTLMWHNHFATSNRKVEDLVLMRQQNELLREHARAPFGDLLRAVVKHPAMLVWLDADANRKGRPNENLAREMLELFTLGVGQYTENDVQSAARALTGWGVVDRRFGFREARHDAGEKTFLDKTGAFDGDELVKVILEHPAAARRIAGRICRTFLGETAVTDEELIALADGLATRELDVGWAVETVLRSQRFFSNAALNGRVTGPIEWAIGTVRALELTDPPPSTLLLAEWTSRMGQDLFYPPNVGGWSEGRAWLSSQTIVARANFAAALLQGRMWHPTQAPDVEALLQRHRKTDDLSASIHWFMDLLWGRTEETAVAEITTAVHSISNEAQLPTAVALILARPESQLS
jgi:uncharacterized protein (DUF1800 family)